MTKYELVPISHELLHLFCELGGRIYFKDPFEIGFMNARPRNNDIEMRRDVLLIGSTPYYFSKLSDVERDELSFISTNFAGGRSALHSKKDNGRLLVIHDD